MSDVLKLGKKIFTVGVVVTTILWSVGVAALVPVVANAASCPSLVAGDMIKVTGKAAIYSVNKDLKVLYFPSGDEFKSWNVNEGYGGYVSVTQECFDSLAVPSTYPGGVNYRPGSWVVKRPSSDLLYVVESNNTLAKVTVTDAKALYGASYKVMTVADAFWPHYVNRGTDIAGKAHEGMLVSKDAKTWYVDAGNVLREVTATGMTANRFKASFVHAVPAAYLEGFTTGATIDAEVAALSNRTQDGGSSTPVTGGAVSVALSAETPAAGSVIAHSTANRYPQAQIPFLKVNFTAGDKAAKITSIKFNRVGIAADTDLGNLYLYDGSTKLAEYTSFSSKVATFSNSSGLFTVAANTTKTVTLKGDLARGSTSVTAGKTIGFAVNALADVVADGTVSGTFPISGNSMTTAAVTDLGQLYITGTTTYPSSIKADEANKEFWRFTANADSQDMQIKYVKFTMIGTIAATDVKNLRLEVGGVQVGTAVELASDNTAIFDLTGNPINVGSGQAKIVTLRGDMNGGSGRVFKFTIQKATDLVVYDTSYGVYVTASHGALSNAFQVLQPTTGNGTTVSSGTLTMGVATDSPTGNVADAGSSLTFAKFAFAAVGEAVKIDSITVKCASGDSTTYLSNVKVLLEGSQIGTTDTSLKCDNGTDTTEYTFGNTFVVAAGATKHLTVVADTTAASVVADDTISASLVAGSGNASGQVTLTSLSTTGQTGRTLTVKSGTVTVSKNSSFSDRTATNPTGTANAVGVKIASFIITAGSGEAVDLTQITLGDDATSQLGDNFQNLTLKNGATPIGSTIGSLNTTDGTYTFSPSSAIRISAGQQYVVDVYADVKSTLADSATSLAPVANVDSVTATGVSTSADASYSTATALQTAYVTAAGNLTVTVDADTPVAGQMVMGDTDKVVAKFKLAADASEDIEISDITVSASTTNSATGTFRNIKLYDGTTQIGQTVQISGTSATTTYANAAFSGLALTIPRNSSKVLTVKADISTFDDGAISSTTHAFGLLVDTGAGTESITAKGKSSGSSITGATLDYGTSPDSNRVASMMSVYRSKISVAWASDTPNGSAVGGTGATIAKINITNSANVGNFDAVIRTMNLAISHTGISTLGPTRTLTIYKDSISTANQVATTDYGWNLNFHDTAITTFTAVTISAGTTKTFIVTLDTNEAGNDDKLSVGVAATDIVWEDGQTQLNAVPEYLPLTSKTLTY